MSVCKVYEIRANSANFDGYDALHAYLSEKCSKWVFQLEKGEKTGYEHYQGRVSLIKKTTPEKAKKVLGDKINWSSPTTTKEHQKTAFYVLKEQTRIKEPQTEQDYKKNTIEYVPVQYKELLKEVKPFQNSIINSKVNFRTVNCVVNGGGNVGKSYVSNVLELLNKGFRLPPLDDYKELMQLLCNYCMDNNIRQLGFLFIDIPKCASQKMKNLYVGIEEILSGKLWDTRNHYKKWYIDTPNIWVFCNDKPDESYLSADRWKFWSINDKLELIPYKDPIEI